MAPFSDRNPEPVRFQQPRDRQSQKNATRNRVLAAAQELFEREGFHGTTVREIALKAGVSVGSVFTSFASKGEILSQVMQDRLSGLYAELDRVLPHLRGSTRDRLSSIFAIHMAFEARNSRLFLAYIAAAYDWTLSPEAISYGRNPALQNRIRECLEKGVAEGDVAPGTDLQEAVQLLTAAFAWTFRHAAWEDADAPAMTAAMDRQIAVIVDGLRPR